jgi:hypothetical protein
MAKASAATKRVDQFAVPEVVAFLNAKDKLEAFKEQYAEMFEQLELIGQEYNAALEAADKAVRAQGISCGPFEVYQTATTYDPTALFDTVGEQRFVELGGKINTVKTYELDDARIEAVVAAGKLPPAVVSAFRKVTPRYHKKVKVAIP